MPAPKSQTCPRQLPMNKRHHHDAQSERLQRGLLWIAIALLVVLLLVTLSKQGRL